MMLKKGDYVFIQFGHNDESKEKVDRYTPPADFTKNLEKFVVGSSRKKSNSNFAHARDAPKIRQGRKFFDTHGEYPDLTRKVAKNLKVPLIDMHRLSEKVLKDLGAENSRSLFLQLKPDENANYPKGIEDNTHFNPKGAEAMARLAVEAIEETENRLAEIFEEIKEDLAADERG